MILPRLLRALGILSAAAVAAAVNRPGADQLDAERHRTAERRNWRAQNRIAVAGLMMTSAGLSGTIAAVGISWSALKLSAAALEVASQEAKDTRRQTDAATTAYLDMSYSGERSLVDWTLNDFPPADITVNIINTGAATAEITDARCRLIWGHVDNEPAGSHEPGTQPIIHQMHFAGTDLMTSAIASDQKVSARCFAAEPENEPFPGPPPDHFGGRPHREAFYDGWVLWLVGSVKFSDRSGKRAATFCAFYDGGATLNPGGSAWCNRHGDPASTPAQ